MIGAGHELGGYTIIKRIGGGGLGEVFLAQHRRVNRRAAVKVLLPELAQKASVLEQFFKEARNTSLIRHPAIVEILDCDIVDGQPFVITEFLEGESLGAYLARAGGLAQDMAFLLGVMSSVAGAVEAAHRAGIMHRDLKPENIYLQLPSPGDPAVTVKVLDFGIAKLSREDGGPSQTKTGLWLASPKYMAPEQCRGTGRPDARSDIYALGCIFYEALCGKPPFESPGIADLILAHVAQAPKPPIKHVPELAPKLNTLLLRMLAKKPEERPQTMEQVGTTLRDCARALGIDLEGQLLPLTAVERPTSLLGAALAGVAPRPSSTVTPPAPLPAPAPPAPRPVEARPIASPPVSVAPAPPAAAPPRQVIPTVMAPDRAPPVSTEAPARPAARAVPRTLIAGAAERQAVAAGRLPEASIEAFAGGTMVMDPSIRPAEPPRPVPARPQPDVKIRAQVGGTRIMEQAGEPEPPEAEPPEEEEEEASFEDASGPRVAGDRTMRVPLGDEGALGRVMTLLTGRAGLAALGAIAVVALVIVLVRLLSGSPAPQHAKRVAPPELVEPPREEQAPAPPAAGIPTPLPAPPREEPPPPPTVVIDIQGIGADTRVMVDGQVVTLPVRVPRGPEVHRFTLRPPRGAERTIEIDGTRDRVIELVMAPDEKAPRPAALSPSGHPHAPAKPPAPRAKKQPGLSDLKPITDI